MSWFPYCLPASLFVFFCLDIGDEEGVQAATSAGFFLRFLAFVLIVGVGRSVLRVVVSHWPLGSSCGRELEPKNEDGIQDEMDETILVKVPVNGTIAGDLSGSRCRCQW